MCSRPSASANAAILPTQLWRRDNLAAHVLPSLLFTSSTFFAENPVDLVRSKEYLQNATLLTIMARLNDGVERSHDSPMEYAWTDGRGPVDHTSPFVQNGKTAEDQRWAAGQKRRFSALSCIGSLELMKSMYRTLK